MFRTIITVASLVGAAAFAPVSQVARSSALKMSFESELGAQPPLGFWDPLGLLAEADQERFDRLRTVETKHGRISMLAILGHLEFLADRLGAWQEGGLAKAHEESELLAEDGKLGVLRFVLLVRKAAHCAHGVQKRHEDAFEDDQEQRQDGEGREAADDDHAEHHSWT